MNFKAIARNFMAAPFVKFPVSVMQRFGEDNGGLFAAGLAFFMLLTFAPLILTAVAVLGFFIKPDEAMHDVQRIVQGMLPAGGAQKELTHFLSDKLNVGGQVNGIIKGRTLAGTIGLLTLFWTSMQIFINASTAMNAAFEVKETRSWLILRGVALGLLLSSGILVTTTLFLSAAPSAIAHFDLPFIHVLPIPIFAVTCISEIIAVLLNALLYLVIYRFLPSTNVGWKAAFIGGLTASIAWEIAKKGIAAYLLRPNLSLYGGLADLIIFVLWIYYSMMILLIGAEVAAVYQKTVSVEHKEIKPGAAPPDREEQVRRTARSTRDGSARKSGKARVGGSTT